MRAIFGNRTIAARTGLGLITVGCFVFYGLYAIHVPLSGDEGYYFRSAESLINLVKNLMTFDLAGAQVDWNSVLDKGWFIPGSSLILGPMRLFSDSVASARIYMAVINLAVLVYILVLAERRFGAKFAGILLLLCLASPNQMLFSFSLVGESLAGKLALLLLLQLYRIALRPADSAFVSVADTSGLAAAVALIILLRHSFLFLAPATVIALAVMYFYKFSFDNTVVRRLVVPVAVITVVVSLPLLMWGAALSAKFGCCYLTTTTVDINSIQENMPIETFQRLRRQYGSGHPAMILHRHYLTRAAQEGASFAELVKADKRRFKLESSWASYFEKRRQVFLRLVGESDVFIKKFWGRAEAKGMPGPLGLDAKLLKRLYLSSMSAWNTIIWHFLIFVLLLSMIIKYPANLRSLDRGFLGKIFVVCMVVQFFFFRAHIRHTIGLIPIMSYLAAHLIHKGLGTIETDAGGERAKIRSVGLLVDSFQWSLIAAVSMLVVVLLLS